ncbi:MAG: GNAT family N-acetyltransferase [Ruminococcaceae bacterium]|nr:GNAT family N-acetyltransferase [Oscillospiraceae bacterium]
MAITKKQFQILTDIDLVWNFMVEIYDPAWANGVPAPFFIHAISSTWMTKQYTHLDRFWLEDGRVVAFVYHEDPADTVMFSLRPGYEFLADEMVAYAAAAFPKGEHGVSFNIFGSQTAILSAAERAGYRKEYEYADLLFDMEHRALAYALPEGFYFVKPEDVDPLKITDLTWKGFGHEETRGPLKDWDRLDVGPEWSAAKSYQDNLATIVAPPPHSTPEYDLIIANEAGEYVCLSGMYWVPENHLAYMEPLCTAPEYRGRGLAAAALTEHYRRFKPLGARLMTGGDNPFYQKIGYDQEVLWTHWIRE